MAEAVAVSPTPSNHPNAPQSNGTAPAVAGTTTTTQPPAAGAPPDITAKYKTLEAEHQRKVREQIVERRKWEGERKSASEKLSKLEQLEKREASARLNPPEFLKSIYGDNWHEVLTEAKVNGVAPAALIQAEFDKFRAEMSDKEKSRADESTKAAESQRQEATNNARATIFAESAAWYRAQAADFPLLKKIGEEPAVARTMAARIEHEFHKSGKVMTQAEVAELIEAEVLEWVQEAGKHEKYKAKLQPTAASSTVAPSKQQQGTQQPAAARRSITNDITGSTSSAKPPASDKERSARAEAAWNAVKARKGD